MEAAVLAGVTQLIYSSSAAVYGPAPERPVTEDDETDPAKPYGETKLAAEWIVRRTAEANGMIWTALRYFNVAGGERRPCRARRHQPDPQSDLAHHARAAGPGLRG